ncbi:MAG: RidA family protein [Holophagales bacterium]|nr:RidA family protein [Holophagales bacterium]
MKIVESPHAPHPAGHYSQAVVHGGLVFVAGQLPQDISHPGRPAGDVEEQTERALRNVEAILEAVGSSLDRLLSVTVYVTDILALATRERGLRRGPREPSPGRAPSFPVKELHHGFLVEVQAVAAFRE